MVPYVQDSKRLSNVMAIAFDLQPGNGHKGRKNRVHEWIMGFAEYYYSTIVNDFMAQ